MDRVTLDDDDFVSIEPRPISPIPEPIVPVIVVPEPPKPQPDHAQEIAQAAVVPYTFVRALPQEADAEEAGQRESDVLLAAIRIVAKREATFVNECALRDLVRRFAHQFSLDF